MCNLNIFLRTDKFSHKKLTSFIMSTTSNSYASNSDGEGIYFSSGLLVKDFDKIDIVKYRDCVNESKVIISHQRLATHGFSKENVQPFVNDEFVLAHNGVMADFQKDKAFSDTHGFFLDFNDEFKKADGENRQEKIVCAIKKLLDNKSGSWSIVLYDKVENQNYYFKNESTNIECYKTKDFAYITTKEANKVFFPMIGIKKGKFGQVKLSAYNIYKFVIKDKIKVYKVGEIEEKKYTYCSSETYNYDSVWSGKRSYDNYNKEEDKMEVTAGDKQQTLKITTISRKEEPKLPYTLELKQVKEEGYCVHCNAKTNMKEADGYFLCADCIRREESWGAEITILENRINEVKDKINITYFD